MNDNAYQETLFAEPIGLQLRHAREKMGMKASDASARLKFPVDVIDALEREDWQKLGAPIYVRSYLSGYLKLLGLPATMISEVRFEQAPTSTMKLLSDKPLRRDIDKTLSTLAYFALTGVIVASVIMIAMHFQAPNKMNEVLPLDIQAQTAPAPLPAVQTQTATPAESQVATAANQVPVMASMAPLAANTTAGNGWEIRVNADSWMEITGADGKRIESGIFNAGVTKQYAADQVAAFTIGNADQVQVLRNGQVVDFSAFKQDNVARFKIAKDGALIAQTAAN